MPRNVFRPVNWHPLTHAPLDYRFPMPQYGRIRMPMPQGPVLSRTPPRTLTYLPIPCAPVKDRANVTHRNTGIPPTGTLGTRITAPNETTYPSHWRVPYRSNVATHVASGTVANVILEATQTTNDVQFRCRNCGTQNYVNTGNASGSSTLSVAQPERPRPRAARRLWNPAFDIPSPASVRVHVETDSPATDRNAEGIPIPPRVSRSARRGRRRTNTIPSARVIRRLTFSPENSDIVEE